MNNQIFIALSTFAADDRRPLEMLEASGFPYKIHQTGKRITGEELMRDAKDAAVIVGGVEPYDQQVISALPGLKCISRCGVGVDAIDLAFAKEKQVVVANTPLVPVQAVAELALTLFLALSRNIKPQANLMQAKRWERVPAHLLSGRTVGLMGFGRIGQRVAQLCNAFGAKVLVYDPYADKSREQELSVAMVSREQLLAESDIISLHASKDKNQPVLIGKAELDQMKQGAILVNLARGEMVEEASLIAALQSGKLAGAGLDVFGQEPYQGPLCDFDQVILTPHCATLTLETRSEMEMQCVENAIDFLNGKLRSDRRVI